MKILDWLWAIILIGGMSLYGAAELIEPKETAIPGTATIHKRARMERANPDATPDIEWPPTPIDSTETWANEGVIASSDAYMTYQSSGTISVSTGTWTTYVVNFSTSYSALGTFEVSTTRKKDFQINGRNKDDTAFDTIVRIDQDGDIFVRGKWVAWDGRLARFTKLWSNYYGGGSGDE